MRRFRIARNTCVEVLFVALLPMTGCATVSTAATAPLTPTQIQGITRIDEMRLRADAMITEMNTTRERLRQHLSDDGSVSATCSSRALDEIDLYIRDAKAKRDGLSIGLSVQVQQGDISPYKTDFGAIAENLQVVKDNATLCGLVPPQPPPPPRNPAPLVVTGIGAGLGVAGLVVGGVLGQMAIAKKEELDRLCPNKKCPPDAKGIADSKDALAAGSTAAFVAGGVLLALSGIPLIVYFAPGSSNSPRTAFFLYSGRF